MTATTMTDLDLLRARMAAALGGQLPGHVRRLAWSPAAGGFLRASVEGRADDLFRYPAASVHPFVIGTPLLRAPAVREFQVRQTERGADLAVVVDGGLDAAALTADVRDGLRQAGLPGPRVTLRRVEALDRDPLTGKARRFIPL